MIARNAFFMDPNLPVSFGRLEPPDTPGTQGPGCPVRDGLIRRRRFLATDETRIKHG